jgi:hypothetical protein
MINFKKGTGHSLAQSDRIAKPKAGDAIVAGMLVKVNTTTSEVEKPIANPDDSTHLVGDLVGFAINNQTDGDVIESGKLGFIMLDGNSVIETDQSDVAINSTNYPVGTRVVGGETPGKVKPWAAATAGRILGYVEGIRNLQSTESINQNYLNLAGATVTTTINTQKNIPVLGNKLAT